MQLARPALLAALLGLAAAPVAAQDYEQLYGPIADVSLDSLYNGASFYEGRGIRTSGRIDLEPGSRQYVISEGITIRFWLIPAPELRAQFESEAMKYLGQRVEVVGVFSGGTTADSSLGGGPRGRIDFWELIGPPEKRKDGDLKASDVSLESLLRSPGQRDGQMVRIVGQFRGRNLFRDLPSSSQRKGSDWVLKDDIFAVWITGRQPRGDGFRLDPTLKRDTGKWLEVVGRVRTVRGTTYLDAETVRLTDAPLRADAGAAPTPTPTPRPRRAPMIVFSLPLDGEQVPQSTLFQLQFSKDMEEESLTGRVVLRYAGPRQPGDRLFDGLKVNYDGGLRALTIDPGDVLRPGREVLLLLLKGIRDVEGLPLEARPGVRVEEGEVAEMLRYRVISEFAGS